MSGRIDIEAIAFAAGAKPAIRRMVAVEHADASAARLAALGGVVRWAHGELKEEGRPSRVIYLARNATDAEALRDAEAGALPGDTGAPRQAAHTEIGLRLGFPRCCVAAFVARVARGVDVVPGHGRGYAEDFVSAREAWVPAARALINPLWAAQRRALVSFAPCAFDCRAALEVARGVLAAVEREDSAFAASLVRDLEGTCVIAPDGARVAVVLAADGAVTSATARPHAGGGVDSLDAALAGALRARRVVAVARRDGPPAPLRIEFVA